MKPMLFNTAMVRALQNGTKTATRRAVKGYALEHLELDTDGSIIGVYDQLEGRVFPVMDYALYRSGDILYVRETFFEHKGHFYYKADGRYEALAQLGIIFKWRPSIHMPRDAAWIFLRVTDVRVERLQDITAEQVLNEGVEVQLPEPKPGYVSLAYTEMRLKPAAIKQFAQLWDSTIKKAARALYGWDANPWVWVIEFERCEKPDED